MVIFRPRTAISDCMQRTFLSNLSLLMVLNLLVKPAYLLLIETEVQNKVGSEEYGHYAALLSLGFLLNIFLDLGINTFTSRKVAQSADRALHYLSSVFLLRLGLAAVYFALLGLGSWLLGYEASSFQLLLWIGLNQLLAASLLYLRSNLSGLHLFKQDAVLSVLDRALAIGVLLLVFWWSGDRFDLRWLVGTQTFAYGVTLVVAAFFLRSHTGKIRWRWRPRLNRIVLGQSIPYALLVLLMMVYYKTDSVMLERMRADGAFQAGIYAMGYRLFEAANMMGYLFATLLLPLFSRAMQEGRSVQGLMDNAYRLVLGGSIPLALLCWFWPESLLNLVYDHDIAEASGAFRLLMVAFIFMMTSHLWGTLLTAKGRMRTMNQIALGAVGLNIGLNLYLIPDFGAWGSAAASLATQIMVAFLQIVLSGRLVGLVLKLSVWLRTILLLSALIGAGYLLKGTDWPQLIQIAAFIALSVSGVFAVGLYRRVGLRSLLGESS